MRPLLRFRAVLSAFGRDGKCGPWPFTVTGRRGRAGGYARCGDQLFGLGCQRERDARSFGGRSVVYLSWNRIAFARGSEQNRDGDHEDPCPGARPDVCLHRGCHRRRVVGHQDIVGLTSYGIGRFDQAGPIQPSKRRWQPRQAWQKRFTVLRNARKSGNLIDADSAVNHVGDSSLQVRFASAYSFPPLGDAAMYYGLYLFAIALVIMVGQFAFALYQMASLLFLS
jgi:hypothetical protein